MPGPPMQTSVPSPPVRRSSPPPPKMQSFPPRLSIVSMLGLPRIRSLPVVPVNVPEPVTRFVKNNPAQVDGLRSLTSTDIVWFVIRVAGTVLVAATAVIALMMMSAISPKIENRSGKGIFTI